MSDTTSMIITFYLLETLSDIAFFDWMRSLLKSFLQGAIGRNDAKRIWRTSHGWKKISLSFLKKNDYPFSHPFQRFYILYQVHLYSVLPLYVLLISVNIIFSAHFIVLLVANGIKVLFSLGSFLIVRLIGFEGKRPLYDHSRNHGSDYHNKRRIKSKNKKQK